VIWSSEGMIVTNAHVVHGPNVCVQLWDGREFEAAVTAHDPRRDLAALRINANSLPRRVRRIHRDCVLVSSPSP